VNIEIPQIEEKQIIDGNEVEDDKNEDEDSDEECDLMFKVKLEKPEPAGVKISKRNVCLVSICQGNHHENEDNDHAKLIEYFMDN
jgi:hypothetical protein